MSASGAAGVVALDVPTVAGGPTRSASLSMAAARPAGFSPPALVDDPHALVEGEAEAVLELATKVRA